MLLVTYLCWSLVPNTDPRSMEVSGPRPKPDPCLSEPNQKLTLGWVQLQGLGLGLNQGAPVIINSLKCSQLYLSGRAKILTKQKNW